LRLHRCSARQTHKGTHQEHRFGAEADGSADPAGAFEPDAAAATVADRVHRDARFARFGSWPGRVTPGLRKTGAFGLAGAAFGRPALGTAGC
jgi:hypothetical protein